MTTPEKLSLFEGDVVLNGAGSGFNACVGHLPGVPRLGVPPLCFGDGPAGVGNGARQVTQFPAPVAGAASWDVDLMRAYGEAMADEHIGKGRDVILGPTLNILRTPRWGRAGESLGEDPYLTAHLGVAVIQGMQSRGAIADAKHFAANNQETDRFGEGPDYRGVDVQVDARTLNEIYFPAFKAAVQEGHVGSVMCAYNRVNGVPACENAAMLRALRDWGFSGFVVADWYLAAHGATASALAGLDISMPGGPNPFGLADYYGAPLAQAVQSDQVPIERINQMAENVITPMITAGLLDRPPRGDPSRDVRSGAHLELARRIATEGAVLLKNQDILPLSPSDLHIAVIGDDAADGARTTEGYGGFVAWAGEPISTPLAALTARAGAGVQVVHARGTLGVGALPLLKPAGGFRGDYYAASDIGGPPTEVRGEAAVDVTQSPAPYGGRPWAARWTATVTAPASGLYRFSVTGGGDARLYVNETLAAVLLKSQFRATVHGAVHLEAGQAARLRLDFRSAPSMRNPAVRLGWATPGDSLIADAAVLARKSDVAVVFVGDDVSEGADRASLALPGDQDALIEAVSAANPRTVVVLNTVGPVLMPWLARVAAVVEAWYPGEEDGAAIAPLLFGDADFSGRLPETFPASDAQGPGVTPATFPGVAGKVDYAEGLEVGYRFYDAQGQTPLFPFGFGLSYARFSLMDLTTAPGLGAGLDVRVSLTNVGARAGAEIAQLYLKFPVQAGEPPWQLKGFQRVTLGAGETGSVTFHLRPEDFAVYDPARGGWRPRTGAFTIRVGRNSRDPGLQRTVTR